MAVVVLGLGSNLDRPLQQLRRAVKVLSNTFDITIQAYSTIYASAPLLPTGAPTAWQNKTFLNAAIKITTSLAPLELLACIKKVEADLGRVSAEKWAPRLIDIDILTYDDIKLSSDKLTIPHAQLLVRPFALRPLLDVLPNFPHTPQNFDSSLEKLPHLLAGPMIMGAINITPDSFSDGGLWLEPEKALNHAIELFADGADIIDIGAESTRPGATLIDEKTEWERLKIILKLFDEYWKNSEHRPLLSLDTRRAAIFDQARCYDIAILNDVSQEEFSDMIPLLKECKTKYVTMHHLGIPPTRDKVIVEACPFTAIKAFHQHWLQCFDQASLPAEQLIFDPGIGFGKNPVQAFTLIKNFNELKKLGGSWLVGHSRKSFLQALIDQQTPIKKELVTAYLSDHLAQQGVDYLRVHDPSLSLLAIRTRQALLA